MKKILEVQDILASIREDNQQLERLIVDLKKEKGNRSRGTVTPVISTPSLVSVL